jgi:hypothetical protein
MMMMMALLDDKKVMMLRVKIHTTCSDVNLTTPFYISLFERVQTDGAAIWSHQVPIDRCCNFNLLVNLLLSLYLLGLAYTVSQDREAKKKKS